MVKLRNKNYERILCNHIFWELVILQYKFYFDINRYIPYYHFVHTICLWSAKGFTHMLPPILLYIIQHILCFLLLLYSFFYPLASHWLRFPFTHLRRINGPLTRYAKLRVAHAPGIPGTFSPPRPSKENASERSRHASQHVRRARAVMRVGIVNMRGKRSWHSQRMRDPQFCVSGKRPMVYRKLFIRLPDYGYPRSRLNH